MRELLRGDDGSAGPSFHRDDAGWRVELGGGAAGTTCVLHLVAWEDAKPEDEQIEGIALRRGWTSAAPCAAAAEALAAQVAKRFRAHLDAQRRAIGGVNDVLLVLAGLLLALLPLACGHALRGLDRRTLLYAGAAVVAAFVVRALAPHLMVMVYFGYQHVGEATDLAHLPRYGPGATMLWWLLFQATPPDHAAVQWLHAALGSLTAGFCVAYVRTVAGGVVAPLAAGALLAFAPIFVRDHGSESMGVPAMFAFSAGALVLARTLRALEGAGLLVDRGSPAEPARPGEEAAIIRSPGRVPLAAPMLSFTLLFSYGALCRPDLALAAVPLAVGLALAAAPARVVGRLVRRAWPFLLAGLVVAVPLALSLYLRATVDRELGNLPRIDSFSEQARKLLVETALVDWRAFPVAVWGLLLVGSFFAGTGRRAQWLAAMAMLSMLPTLVDFNEVSVLRLHAPAGVFLVMAAGLALGALERRGRGARLAAAVLAAGALASAWPSREPLFRERNPDQEEALQREALRALAKEAPKGAVLARLAYPDLTIRDVHLAFPDYLFTTQGLDVRNVAEASGLVGQRPVYFLRSLRCYLWPGWDQEQPKGVLHDACARVCREHRCRPLFERDLPNRGDWSYFDGYGSAPTLRVGLYEVTPAAPR